MGFSAAWYYASGICRTFVLSICLFPFVSCTNVAGLQTWGDIDAPDALCLSFVCDMIWYDIYLLQSGFHPVAVVDKLVQK